MPVANLAAELGWSRRHLGERIRADLGLPPKIVGRILRFDRVKRLLERDDGHRLAEIALDCGYYDQAHLNRDFREFADATPSEFLARRLPDGGGVAGPAPVGRRPHRSSPSGAARSARAGRGAAGRSVARSGASRARQPRPRAARGPRRFVRPCPDPLSGCST